jgi:hypothetical protein
MAISAQDKMLYVAKKLGLNTLKDMQGSTRVIYDQITTASNSHTLFAGSGQRNFPDTNLGANGNQFQVNEALLIEQIAFFIPTENGINYGAAGQNGLSVKFDLVIGNKTVIKDCVIEKAGQQAFMADTAGGSSVLTLEGVGILIPPQVEFYVRASAFNTETRVSVSTRLGCYLFGTAALLNFNTTI